MNKVFTDYVYVLCLTTVLVQPHYCFSEMLKENIDEMVENNTELLGKEASLRGSSNSQGGGGLLGGGIGGGIMNRILPYLITPFLISSFLVPPMLAVIKVLLMKSLLVGKIASIIMLINFLRKKMEGGGVYNHYVSNVQEEHYGYKGVEEPGIYVHKRRKKRNVKIC